MSVLLDEETVVLDALDFEVQCRRGEHPAEVLVRCRGCGAGSMLCRRHLAEARAQVDGFVASSPGLVVLFCKCGRRAATFDELVDVVDL